MSYHIYTTEGIVLRGLPSGEADKYFFILTRDLGLIIASARSVRKSSSKLASGLEDYSSGNYSFVRGKHSWKLTSVESPYNSYRLFRGQVSEKLIWARFLSLVRRMVKGEEKHRDLFSISENLRRALIAGHHSERQLLAIESLAILKLLFSLGYIDPRPDYASFFQDEPFLEESVARAMTVQKEIVRDINHALKESHL